MKIIYTDFSLFRMHEAFLFLRDELEVPAEKILVIRETIKTQVRLLLTSPYLGQREFLLDDLQSDHRRLIVGHFKIIYRIKEFHFRH